MRTEKRRKWSNRNFHPPKKRKTKNWRIVQQVCHFKWKENDFSHAIDVRAHKKWNSNLIYYQATLVLLFIDVVIRFFYKETFVFFDIWWVLLNFVLIVWANRKCFAKCVLIIISSFYFERRSRGHEVFIENQICFETKSILN